MILRGSSPAAVVLVVLWISLAAAPEAHACMCFSTPCGSITTAAHVFEATVVAVEPFGPAGQTMVRLGEVRPLRGEAPPAWLVGGDSRTCAYQFQVGVRYLIDAQQAPGRLMVSSCSYTRPIEAARGLLDLLSTTTAAERPRIFGRVTADDLKALRQGWAGGAPVGGALVTLDGPVRVNQATTPNGEFSFRELPDGGYDLAVAIPPDRQDVRAPKPRRVILERPAVCANVELVAPSTSRVTGTIVDPNGAPAAGVFVEIFPAPFDEWAGGVVHGASSDGEGRFVIEGLPTGRYVGGVGVPYPRRREAVAPAMARTLGGATALEVDPGVSIELAPIVAVPAPRVTIRGRVIAPPGAPPRSRTVVLQPVDGFVEAAGIEAGATFPDGTFIVDANRGVRYRLLVEDRPSVVVGRTEFVAGDSVVEVVLDPPR